MPDIEYSDRAGFIPGRWPKWAGYSVTVAMEALLTLLLVLIRPHFPMGDFHIIYVLLLMAVAYLFGEGPAFLAFVLGYLAYIYFFVTPLYTFWPPVTTLNGWAGIIAYLLGSLVVGFAMLLIRRSHRHIERLLQDLKEAGRHTAEILENTPDAFFALDRQWHITYVNSKMEEFLRQKREGLVGKTLWDAYPEVIRGPFYEVYKKAMTESVNAEKEGYSDIFGRWIELRVYPSAEGVTAYARDISERKQAVQALHESEERLRAILDNANAVINLKDTAGRHILANRQYEEIFHISRERVIGKTVYDLMPVEYADAVSANDRKVLKLGTALQFEEEIRLEDGVHTYVSVKFPLKDSAGRIYGICGISTDITERKQAERLSDALNDINAAISSTLDYSEIMQRVMVESAKAIGAEAAGIALRENGHWVASYLYGFSSETIGTRYTDAEAPMATLVARDKRLLVINDAYNDERVNRELMKRLGIHSVLAVPLVVREEVIGVLLFNYRSATFNFTNAQIDFAYKISVSVSLALENARLYTERKQSAELSSALNDINAAMASTMDFDEIMRRVVVESARAIDTETAAINLREGHYWVVKFTYGEASFHVGDRFSNLEIPFIRLAERSKRPVVINDTETDSRVNREVTRRYGVRSVLMVPLIIRGEMIGGLFFNHHSPDVSFDEVQVDFAGKLGASISLALENARLYQIERDIADTLQESLLVMPEKVEGIDFSYLYHSAIEVARVGGDFYDIFELEHKRVGIVIGDVSGKGLHAAALTSLVKNTIRAYAYESDSPAEIMRKTNEVVCWRTPDESEFVTVFFGILDLTLHKIIYCNAGHPPVMLIKASRDVLPIEPNSSVVGAFAETEYSEIEIELEHGDALLLYTDGVIEARSDGELFGEERLVKCAKDLAGVSVEEVPQRVFDVVLDFTRGRPADDIALLAVSPASP